jgi:HAD superfamily hydrolase (TIGR01509 family)
MELWMMIMKRYDWIFFDLDGTLADSIGKLYDVYIKFLKEFGIDGNKKEFEILNGPSLNEIILILKKKYHLPKTKIDLLDIYEKKLEFTYENSISLIPKRFELLCFLKNNNYNLALVTSLSQKIVLSFLSKNNLKHFFNIIISGDDVKNSKPNPEIYNLCLSKTKSKKDKILVLEDSKNGYESAVAAGLDCKIIKNKTEKEISSLFM